MIRRWLSLTAMLAGVLASAEATPQAVTPSPPFRFDGLALGDVFRTAAMSRPAYAFPCDHDPVDHASRTMVGYGATPCRGHSFPDGTTLMVFLAPASPDPLMAPIVAVAWVGGSYFDRRTPLAIHVGDALVQASSSLGAPLRTLVLEDGPRPLTVEVHRANLHVIALDGRILGFVMGPMPSDPDNEQWRMIEQGYWRFTHPH